MPSNQVKAPMPGVFYHSPSPEENSYKQVGDSVSEGDVIGLIEVMKSFHEIKSNTAGTLTGFLVDDGDAVMAGQELVTIDA